MAIIIKIRAGTIVQIISKVEPCVKCFKEIVFLKQIISSIAHKTETEVTIIKNRIWSWKRIRFSAKDVAGS